jgi:hypothetical protein
MFIFMSVRFILRAVAAGAAFITNNPSEDSNGEG